MVMQAAMLQGSEVDLDVVMQDHEQVHAINGHDNSNGFVDPRVLSQIQDADVPDSAEQAFLSQDETPPMSHDVKDGSASRRRAFLPTGCCYDDRMKLHANADFSASPHHPEDPRRIQAIMQEFRNAGLVYTGTAVELKEAMKLTPNKWMWRITARKATYEEICTAHTPQHYEWVRALADKTSAQLRDMTQEFDNGRKSLYVGNLTYQAALISAGGAIETCKNVVSGKVKNAIAVIRPPGHHAEHNESLGFCIFNNVPIAAKVCMMDYPELCRKVLILDWDVHHGNGIQNMFYEDPNVLYISLHVYADGQFYPGQPEDDNIPDGGLDKCGYGKGFGKNINIGWSEQGVGDGEYMRAFQEIVMPIAHEFDPDLVIVSAGFDAAAGDDLGGCFVSPQCYSHMTHMLMSLANGKVAVCLEGGYDLRAISLSALAVARTLMGEPPERMENIKPCSKEAFKVIANVKRIQSSFWQAMRPGIIPLVELQERGTSRLSQVIRTAQRSVLREKHRMLPLKIIRNRINETFDNHVLVTPSFYEARKILLIIHDPPEVLGQPDPNNNTLYPHNTFVTDGLLPYIDWAIEKDFAVVDINIPQDLTEQPYQVSSSNYTDPYLPKSGENDILQQTKELLCWIYDNYLEVTEKDTSITMLGVGDASLGIKTLLVNRPNAKQKITGILSFVSGSLRPVKSDADPDLSPWYKNNTLIYVVPYHACFQDRESKYRVRKKRFGRVVRADIPGGVDTDDDEVQEGLDEGARQGRSGNEPRLVGTGIEQMLKRYESEGPEWMKESVKDWRQRYGFEDSEDDDEEAEGEGMTGADELSGDLADKRTSVRIPA